MRDDEIPNVPPVLARIRAKVEEIGFKMSCDDKTGALLCALIASKPNARALELGTGAGVSTAWLLQGLGKGGRLQTIDSDEALVAVAREFLASDPRVEFFAGDGEAFLAGLPRAAYDFVFADTWPGKFYALEACLDRLADGALYVIDDLLPQETWPEGHGDKVVQLLEKLEARRDLTLVKLDWSTGIVIATKTARA